MGEVVQIRDYQKKKEPIDPANLNHMAVSIFNECFPQQIYETSLGFVDTAPSEYSPTDDCA